MGWWGQPVPIDGSLDHGHILGMTIPTPRTTPPPCRTCQKPLTVREWSGFETISEPSWASYKVTCESGHVWLWLDGDRSLGPWHGE
jgi:hypothetical protein